MFCVVLSGLVFVSVVWLQSEFYSRNYGQKLNQRCLAIIISALGAVELGGFATFPSSKDAVLNYSAGLITRTKPVARSVATVASPDSETDRRRFVHGFPFCMHA